MTAGRGSATAPSIAFRLAPARWRTRATDCRCLSGSSAARRRSARRSAAAGRDCTGIAGRSSGAVHVVVARIGRREMRGLAGVGADGLGAEAEHVALVARRKRTRRDRGRACAGRCRRDSGRRRGRCASTSRSASAPRSPRRCGRAVSPMPMKWRTVSRKSASALGFGAAVDDAGRRDEMLDSASYRSNCPAGRGRKSNGSARRNACRCARRSSDCSSTSPARARRSARSPPCGRAGTGPFPAATRSVENPATSVCVRSTSRTPPDARRPRRSVWRSLVARFAAGSFLDLFGHWLGSCRSIRVRALSGSRDSGRASPARCRPG